MHKLRSSRPEVDARPDAARLFNSESSVSSLRLTTVQFQTHPLSKQQLQNQTAVMILANNAERACAEEGTRRAGHSRRRVIVARVTRHASGYISIDATC